MSRSYQLLLPRQFYTEMLAQAQSELPNECCGLLAGVIDDAQQVLRVRCRYPLINEAASPVEYRADPKSNFQAHKDIRVRRYQILAIYHSHPTSAAIPSRTDLERHYSADVVSFIISLQESEPVLRGWRLSETDYEEANWTIIAEAEN